MSPFDVPCACTSCVESAPSFRCFSILSLLLGGSVDAASSTVNFMLRYSSGVAARWLIAVSPDLPQPARAKMLTSPDAPGRWK